MKFKTKLFTVAVALSAFVQLGHAETINLLVPFPPGGLTDQTLRAFDETFKSKGIETNYLILNSCKNVENWLAKNPEKPAVTVFSVQEQINTALNPTADNACKTVVTKQNTLVMTLTAPMNLCSMLPADQALVHFRKGNHKIGATFSPTTNRILINGLVKTLDLKSSLIEYQGNPKLLQALISKDIDFVLVANVAPAISAGATCFFTTGTRDFAKKFGRTSIDEISTNNPWRGNSQMNVALGWNVDTQKIRSYMIESMKTNANMQKQLSVGHTMPGLISGTSEDEQWKIISDYIESSTKK
jgi:hypothetical protein